MVTRTLARRTDWPLACTAQSAWARAAASWLLCCVLAACAPAADQGLAEDLATSVHEPSQPTLADFWSGRAQFRVDQADTGLPMGESDTVVLPNGEFRSCAHASYPSLGVVDQCGAPCRSLAAS